MGVCTLRTFLLTICSLQFISTVARQIFDILGFMFVPILANFFHTVFVIFGFCGTFQQRPKYIITYSLWSALWLGWNAFIIYLYLEVGILDIKWDILNMGTGSVSWWEVNGIGCNATYPNILTADSKPFRPVRPEHVVGCVLDYQYVEVLHAALQCLLAVFGSAGGVSLSYVLLKKDDSLPATQIVKRNVNAERISLDSVKYNVVNDARRSHWLPAQQKYFLKDYNYSPAIQIDKRKMNAERKSLDSFKYNVVNDASRSCRLPAPHIVLKDDMYSPAKQIVKRNINAERKSLNSVEFSSHSNKYIVKADIEYRVENEASGSCWLPPPHMFLEEVDSSSTEVIGNREMNSKRKLLYSVESSSHSNNAIGNNIVECSVENDAGGSCQLPAAQLSNRLMAPRRLMRHSEIPRWSTAHSSLPLAYLEECKCVGCNTANQPSLRIKQRRNEVPQANPASQLIEQHQTLHQRQMIVSSESNYSDRHTVISSSQMDLHVANAASSQWKVPTGHKNLLYHQNSSQSLQEHSQLKSGG